MISKQKTPFMYYLCSFVSILRDKYKNIHLSCRKKKRFSALNIEVPKCNQVFDPSLWRQNEGLRVWCSVSVPFYGKNNNNKKTTTLWYAGELSWAAVRHKK